MCNRNFSFGTVTSSPLSIKNVLGNLESFWNVEFRNLIEEMPKIADWGLWYVCCFILKETRSSYFCVDPKNQKTTTQLFKNSRKGGRISTRKLPSKHFNIGSTLFLVWYDVATSHNVKSTLKKRCVCQRWNLQRRATLKQHCVFQRRFSQRWATSKQRFEYDHLKKNISLDSKTK